MTKREWMQDRFLGCLELGALGDALGYAIEFDKIGTIRNRYGKHGIQDLVIAKGEKASVISDDTQMTLFTAMGLIRARKDGAGVGMTNTNSVFREMLSQEKAVMDAINASYLDWLATQYDEGRHSNPENPYDDPRLYAWRAPGNTCLNSLRMQTDPRFARTDSPYRTVMVRANDSCGCGGVMRVAPIGLVYAEPQEAFFMACEAAAITHGHDLGFLSAGLLADIVSRCIYQRPDYVKGGLREVICDALADLKGLAADSKYLDKQVELCEKAMEYAEKDLDDVETIEKKLGGGWVGQEAIAIAIYCALKYENRVHRAMCVSVNHSGDSDSTGAVAGNILGAWYGRNHIRQEAFRWDILEMTDLIERIGLDLCDCI